MKDSMKKMSKTFKGDKRLINLTVVMVSGSLVYQNSSDNTL